MTRSSLLVVVLLASMGSSASGQAWQSKQGTGNPTPVLVVPAEPPQPVEVSPVVTEVPRGAEQCHPWGKAEFLIWWIKDYALPPLVSTSTSQESLGVLDRADSRVLYGGKVDGDVRLGGRFTLGLDFGGSNPCDPSRYGVETVFFFLDQQNKPFFASSVGNPVLARPFFDVVNGAPFSEQVANQQIGVVPPGPGPRPGFARAFTGSIAIDNRSRVWGAELNAGCDAWPGNSGCQLRGLVGFRHFGLEESLRIREDLVLPAVNDLTVAPANVLLPETAITITDTFRTKNYFYGPQVGARATAASQTFSLEVTGKVALGWMQQSVDIHGLNVNVTRDPTTGAFLAPRSSASGLLAQPTNNGYYSRSRFAVVPEVTANLGYKISDWAQLFVGYNFLYVSSVVRPGNQIDTGVDVRARTGGTETPTDATRPAPLFRDTDFWVQGLQVGLGLTY